MCIRDSCGFAPLVNLVGECLPQTLLMRPVGRERKMCIRDSRKTALFVIISDTDDTFNFVVSILYTQLFNLLCDKADDELSLIHI